MTKTENMQDGRHMLANAMEQLAKGLALDSGAPVWRIAKAMIDLERAMTCFSKADKYFIPELETQLEAELNGHISLFSEPLQNGLRGVATDIRYTLAIQPLTPPFAPSGGEDIGEF